MHNFHLFLGTYIAEDTKAFYNSRLVHDVGVLAEHLYPFLVSGLCFYFLKLDSQRYRSLMDCVVIDPHVHVFDLQLNITEKRLREVALLYLAGLVLVLFSLLNQHSCAIFEALERPLLRILELLRQGLLVPQRQISQRKDDINVLDSHFQGRPGKFEERW